MIWYLHGGIFERSLLTVDVSYGGISRLTSEHAITPYQLLIVEWVMFLTGRGEQEQFYVEAPCFGDTCLRKVTTSLPQQVGTS